MSVNKPISLLHDILWFRWSSRLLILFCSLLAAFFGLLGPFFQKEFIDLLTHTPTSNLLSFLPQESPMLYMVLAFFAILLSMGFGQLTNYLGFREAIFLQKRFALNLYDKMMDQRIDSSARRSLGEVVALYATDVPGATVFLEQTLPMGAATFFPLILAPFAISLMFDTSLWTTVTAIGAICLLNFTLAFRQSKFFFIFKQLAAERIGLVNEWVQNIRTLRILGWTKSFETSILDVRRIETVNRVKMVTNGQAMNAISSSVTFFLNLATLTSLIYFSKKQLSGGEIFAVLWITGIFLTRPFRQMPWFFTFAFDSWTSLKRVENFLNLPNTSNAFGDITPENPHTYALDVKGLSLTIGQNKILDRINLQVKPGEFVAIVGEVGSGKTLLLLSLLGETGAQFDHYYFNGENAAPLPVVEWRKRFAYVPQEAFIMSASLRENVAFDYDLETQHDSQIIDSLRYAQFDLDQERLNEGLATEIGERGVNLSGGQKQRINLARVQFYNSPILLLDDCLSAVDVDTENKLVDEVMKDAWKERTRILVTHRLSVLPEVDRVLFLSNGRIVEEGTYESLLKNSKAFREFTHQMEETKVSMEASCPQT